LCRALPSLAMELLLPGSGGGSLLGNWCHLLGLLGGTCCFRRALNEG